MAAAPLKISILPVLVAPATTTVVPRVDCGTAAAVADATFGLGVPAAKMTLGLPVTPGAAAGVAN